MRCRSRRPVACRVKRCAARWCLLEARGYIYRSADGYLYLTQTVGDGFEDMTAALVEDLLVTAQRLEALLA